MSVATGNRDRNNGNLRPFRRVNRAILVAVQKPILLFKNWHARIAPRRSISSRQSWITRSLRLQHRCRRPLPCLTAATANHLSLPPVTRGPSNAQSK